MYAIMSNWTEDKIAILRSGWLRGASASTIAVELGRDFTKNSVVGKAHRLKLEQGSKPKPKQAPKPKKPFGARTQRIEPEPLPEEEDSDVEEEPGGIFAAFEARGDGCSYPIGNPRKPTFRFCGKAKETEGRSYCDKHWALTHTTSKR